MGTPLAYYDLVETFPKPGCAICNLLLRDVDQYLDSLLYEYVNDPATHRAFRGARGLCNAHGWQLTRYMGNSLGIAVLYRAAVDEVLKIIERTPIQTNTPSGLANLLGANSEANGLALADSLEPTGQCLACALAAAAEKRYIQTFSQHMANAQLQDAYRASDGLCLPHFRQALRETRNPIHLQQMISIQRDIWGRLKADLEEFESKSSHDRQHEPMGAEGDSWRRAIGRMAGEKGVFSLDRRSS